MMTRRILAGLAASVVVLGASCVSHSHKQAHTPAACAKHLGIAYSRQDGATERLVAFKRCVRGEQ